MPLYTSRAAERAQPSNLPQDYASLSEVAGSAAELALLNIGLNRFIGGQVIVPLLGGRTLAPSEAYARARNAGITDIEITESGIQEDELTFLINHKTYLNNLKKDVARVDPNSFAAQAGLFGIDFLVGGFADPLTYVGGGAGLARKASMGFAKRAAYRFGRGAAQGTVGGVVSETLGAIGDQRLQNDWSFTNSLVNIAGSGFASGVFSAGGGAIFDLFSKPGVDIGKALDVDTPLLSDDSLNVYNLLDGVSADALSIHQSNANIIAGLKDIGEVLDSLPQSKHFEFVDTALRQMEAGEPVNMTGMIKTEVDKVSKQFSLIPHPFGQFNQPIIPISAENLRRVMSRNKEGQGNFSVIPARQENGDLAVFNSRKQADDFIRNAPGNRTDYIVELRNGKYEVLKTSNMFPALDAKKEVLTFETRQQADAFVQENGGQIINAFFSKTKSGKKAIKKYSVIQNVPEEIKDNLQVNLQDANFYRRHRARLVQDVPAGQKAVDAPIATGRSVLQYSPSQEIVKPQRATFRQEPTSVAERLDAPLVEAAKIKDSVRLADTTNDALRLRAASLDMETLSPAMREGVAEALKTIDAGKTLQKRAETTAEIARKYATCLTGIVT